MRSKRASKSTIIDDRDTLVAALRLRGVDYLAPSDAELQHSVTDDTLIASLAAHADPRLRQALIALFLLHPGLARFVRDVRSTLAPSVSCELVAFYTAAVYLQRMWRVRLGHYLTDSSELPDLFSDEFGLPRPAEGHGKFGLHALAEWHAAQSPAPGNHLSEYQSVVDHVFASLKLKC